MRAIPARSSAALRQKVIMSTNPFVSGPFASNFAFANPFEAIAVEQTPANGETSYVMVAERAVGDDR